MLKHAVPAAVCLLGVLAVTTPAYADIFTSADCDQNPYPGCELAAGQNNSPQLPPDGDARPAPRAGGSQGGTASGPAVRPPGDVSLDPSELATCSYTRSDFQPAGDPIRPVAFRSIPRDGGPHVVAAVHRPGSLRVLPAATAPDRQPGAWYVYQCQNDGWRDALYRPPVWIPDGQAGPAATAPDPEALAEQARNQLRLQGPTIALSPTGRQLIRLPTWMWLDPAGWHPVSATAAAGGVSVTAVATPAEVVWAMGDGAQVRCTGPGTPYRPDIDPKASSPDCGHTYQTVSDDQPGAVFPVTATITWNVTWTGAGQTGTFNGLTTVSTTQVTVISIPALSTGGG